MGLWGQLRVRWQKSKVLTCQAAYTLQYIFYLLPPLLLHPLQQRTLALNTHLNKNVTLKGATNLQRKPSVMLEEWIPFVWYSATGDLMCFIQDTESIEEKKTSTSLRMSSLHYSSNAALLPSAKCFLCGRNLKVKCWIVLINVSGSHENNSL